MKKQGLLIFLLCAFLGACSGGTSRSGGATFKFGKDPRDCKALRGEGKQTWNRALNRWNAECKAVICDAGYDDHDDDGDCTKTVAGYYSPSGTKERFACKIQLPENASWAKKKRRAFPGDCVWICKAGYDTADGGGNCQQTPKGFYSLGGSNARMACPTTPPANASLAVTAGLASASACFICNAGYDDHDKNNTCEETEAGFFSPAGSNGRTACSTPADSAPVNTAGLGQDSECFTCNVGYDDVDEDGDCDLTSQGFFSPAGSNDRTACPTPADSAPVNTAGLGQDSECFTCNAGYDNVDEDGDCDLTSQGFFSPAGSNDRTACSTPADSAPVNTAGLGQDSECFTCNAGYDDVDEDGDCDLTPQRFFSPAGSNDRTACPTPADSAPVNTAGLGQDSECFTCNAGYDNENKDETCEQTSEGFYSPAGTSRKMPCPTPAHSTAVTQRGLSDATQCFVCNGGYDNFNDPFLCLKTPAGYYSPAADNNRLACTNAIQPANTSWTSATGLTANSECVLACDAGYDDHDSPGTCAKTPVEHYSPPGNDNRMACADVTLPTHASRDATSTGLASARDCWNCDPTGDSDYYKPSKGDFCALKSTAIDINQHHLCALLKNGTIKCWGSSDGKGGETPDLGGSTAKAIATGRHHTCAILQDGSVKCWGSHSHGQLGSSTGVLPVARLGFPAYALSAGEYHTCAVLDDDGDTTNGGPVACWGWNTRGQLGAVPSKDNGLLRSGMLKDEISGATAIAAGAYHTCALLAGGNVQCWGGNFRGQTGGVTLAPASNPVTVSIGGGAKALAVGHVHTCVILNDGGVKCWGSDGWAADIDLEGEQAKAISAGWNHACVLLKKGSIRCWGDSAWFPRSFPHDIPLNLEGKTATAIVSGYEMACVLLDTGAIKCWGRNSNGKVIGYTGPNAEMDLGKEAGGQKVKASLSPRALALRFDNTCLILNTGKVQCWGDQIGGESPDLGSGNRATAITGGIDHVCVILQDGAVKCWGNNWSGQTGDTPNLSTSAVGLFKVGLGGDKATALAAGRRHTCALLNTGRVKCWGANGSGQTGSKDGNFTGLVDLDLGDLYVRALVAGSYHTCALLENKKVKCWGNNFQQQLGFRGLSDTTLSMDIKDVPSVVLPGDAVALAAGSYHTCVLLHTGDVRCWGSNHQGQIENIVGATKVIAGVNQTCAVLNTGRVKCWGNNRYGQLGGGLHGRIHQSVEFNLSHPLTAISTGYRHTCAVLNTGAVNCWGTGIYGWPVELHRDFLNTHFR